MGQFPPNDAAERRGDTILVVDDEDSIRHLVRSLFTRMSMRVLDAADGLEGIETFRANEPDIRAVLLDLSMPFVDGAEACRVMCSIRPGLPVIVMSGHSDDEVRDRCHGLPLNAIIRKPFTAAQLQQAFRSVLLKV